MKKHFIIGITGGSGSGKTSVLREIKENFDREDVCIVSQDDYYKAREEQLEDEKGIKNFDLPESIELDELYRDLHELTSGQVVTRQEYIFNNSLKTPGIKKFFPAPIIIVEGLFVFTHKKLLDTFDLKVFVDAKDHLKIIRRIVRDKVERNYPLDDVLYRYENHVQPAYEKYVLPYKYKADVIINNHRHYRKGLTVLNGFLKSYLSALKAQNCCNPDTA